MTDSRSKPLGRRSVVLGLGAAALAACSSPSKRNEGGSASSSGHSSTSTHSPATALDPDHGKADTTGAATKDEIVASLGTRRPTAWGLNLPGVRQVSGGKHVALTFDACGGPGGSGVDDDLIALLRKYRVPATLFLNARWIDANEALTKQLLADPLFQVANHGVKHVPLSANGRSAYGIKGTANVGAMYDEIAGPDPWFTDHAGGPRRYMRPGTAYTDDVAVMVARKMKREIVGFRVNADAGATFNRAQVKQQLDTVKPGDIVISHMNQPKGETAEGYTDGLPPMLKRGLTFGHLV